MNREEATREILFRGKRLDNRKWYYGSYLFLHVQNHDWTGARKGPAEDVHFIIDKNDINFAVDPSTVGRYTGLTDKNGVKIFEGDILAREGSKGYKENFEVWWSKGSCGFIAGRGVRVRPNLNPGTVDHYEVIGNIHDNPELLEGDESNHDG